MAASPEDIAPRRRRGFSQPLAVPILRSKSFASFCNSTCRFEYYSGFGSRFGKKDSKNLDAASVFSRTHFCWNLLLSNSSCFSSLDEFKVFEACLTWKSWRLNLREPRAQDPQSPSRPRGGGIDRTPEGARTNLLNHLHHLFLTPSQCHKTFETTHFVCLFSVFLLRPRARKSREHKTIQRGLQFCLQNFDFLAFLSSVSIFDLFDATERIFSAAHCFAACRNLWRKADSVSDIKHFQLSSVAEESRKLKRTNSSVSHVQQSNESVTDTEDAVASRSSKRNGLRRLQFTSLRTKDMDVAPVDAALDSIYTSCRILPCAGFRLDSLLDPPVTSNASDPSSQDPVKAGLELAEWIGKHFCEHSTLQVCRTFGRTFRVNILL
jgi:hypothetical protein